MGKASWKFYIQWLGQWGCEGGYLVSIHRPVDTLTWKLKSNLQMVRNVQKHRQDTSQADKVPTKVQLYSNSVYKHMAILIFWGLIIVDVVRGFIGLEMVMGSAYLNPCLSPFVNS